MSTAPSATPEPYAHEWHITVKADEHAGAIDALFNCIKAWQSGSEPIGGTCPRSMGNRQTYDVVKGGREGRTLETELAALQSVHDTRLHAFEEYKKVRDAELARLRAELAVAENWVEHHSKHADDLIGENVKLRAEVEQMKDYAFWKDTAQTRAENLERASEQMLVHEQTIARLRSEVEKATAKIANQAERIRYLEGATNHATGTPLSLADARKDSERLREALERLHGVVVSAGITNLSRGVQLGQISWHHKAEDAVASARAAIDAAKGTQ